MKEEQSISYGVADGSFKAAGGVAGITALATEFYTEMSTNIEYHSIFSMHQREKQELIERLARFLCAWMGGPKLYQRYYGPISIPNVHAHFPIKEKERDLWLSCMETALNRQPYHDTFKQYLMKQFSIPAELIRKRCRHARISP